MLLEANGSFHVASGDSEHRRRPCVRAFRKVGVRQNAGGNARACDDGLAEGALWIEDNGFRAGFRPPSNSDISIEFD
ncbi:MAG: hypothetical protein M3453_07625 [Pseudomonadota bacterium]|nr:hypothetical protein [Pseudomonadota bacterium]